MKYSILFFLLLPLATYAQNTDLKEKQRIYFDYNFSLKCSDAQGNFFLSLPSHPYLVKADTQGNVIKAYGKDLKVKSDTMLLKDLSFMAVDSKGSIFFLTKEDTAIYQLKEDHIGIFSSLKNLNKIIKLNDSLDCKSYDTSPAYIGLGIDKADNLYLGDRCRAAIWKINKRGIPGLLTNRKPSESKTEQVKGNQSFNLSSFAVSNNGEVYFMAFVPKSKSDSAYNGILKVTRKGIIRTLIKYHQTYPGGYTDGKEHQAQFDLTRNLQIDQDDNLYFASSVTAYVGKTFYHYNGMRRFKTDKIETVAGCGFHGNPFNALSNFPLTFNGDTLFPELDKEPENEEEKFFRQHGFPKLRALSQTKYGLFLGGEDDADINFISNKQNQLIIAGIRNNQMAPINWESLGISREQAPTFIPIQLTVVNIKDKITCNTINILVEKK